VILCNYIERNECRDERSIYLRVVQMLSGLIGLEEIYINCEWTILFRTT
jgi:hypothetical protein